MMMVNVIGSENQEPKKCMKSGIRKRKEKYKVYV
jgi:hypothetical protein